MTKPAANAEPTHLGRRIRKLRTAAKISARQLSEDAGASPSVVSQIETGLILQPSGAILNGIAVALGTTVEFLLTGCNRRTGTNG